MRKVYAGFVAKQIEAGSEIIALEADLMSSMAMDGVARDYPQHVINCGIMEANVIGTAAGLSLTGRKPFVHTFTAFASRRCFDQLFMSLDYQRNNVKVIASDAGVTACHNGGTHMSFEDMGIVRGLAHSVVLEVTDAVMFEDVLRQLIDLEGFYWVRTIRKQAPSVYAPGSTFTIGKGNVLREGTDITLIANGIMVAEALEAARQLEQEGGKRGGHRHVYPEAYRPDAGEKLRRKNRSGGGAGGNLPGADAAGGRQGALRPGGDTGFPAEGVWPDGT
ncbi:hypothetical protein L1887_46414 [Cichorium endivia]|nr:hypothetical protein L1887_46414 [Cichorium endivia]